MSIKCFCELLHSLVPTNILSNRQITIRVVVLKFFVTLGQLKKKTRLWSGANSEPCQTSDIKCFRKLVNGFQFSQNAPSPLMAYDKRTRSFIHTLLIQLFHSSVYVKTFQLYSYFNYQFYVKTFPKPSTGINNSYDSKQSKTIVRKK